MTVYEVSSRPNNEMKAISKLAVRKGKKKRKKRRKG
jgi:hypothetical protein